MKSSIKIHGGKYYLAPKIVELFPKHIHYVEPFFGSGAVLFARDPGNTSEAVNDMNAGLINFWKVLQGKETFQEFVRVIQVTPFSEYEFNKFKDISNLNPEECDVHSAIAFFVVCRQSMSGRMKSFTPLTRTRLRRGMNAEASAWWSAVERLPEVHERLKRVVILNRPALDVIISEDYKNTLFYLDPPYLHSTRVSISEYGEHEMSKEDHILLLETIIKCKGKVILSGYDNLLYDRYLCDWNKKVFKISNNSSSQKKKPVKEEVVWMNY